MKILSLILIMSMGISYSSWGADGNSDQQQSSSDIIAMFLNSIPADHFEPYIPGGQTPTNSVADAFAKALSAGNHVSANCAYVGRSLLQRCNILVQEGGGEGLGRTHLFQFDIGGKSVLNGTVRYVIAL